MEEFSEKLALFSSSRASLDLPSEGRLFFKDKELDHQNRVGQGMGQGGRGKKGAQEQWGKSARPF